MVQVYKGRDFPLGSHLPHATRAAAEADAAETRRLAVEGGFHECFYDVRPIEVTEDDRPMVSVIPRRDFHR